MGKVTLDFLAFVLACASAGSARADKDSACETYALSAMRQIKETAKHEGCLERGFFSGDRWRDDFNFHYNACAQRYDAATKGHLAFTRGEKEARDGQLSACIDKEARGNGKDHGKDKDTKKDRPELTECTIQQPGGGGGCKTGFKRVCEKLKSGKKCCGCVPDKSAQTPAGERIEDHPCFVHCSSTKCGGAATKEVRDACVLDCLQSTSCTPH
jgi:hypothetical protein